jgi:hypothetical protein
MDEQIRKRVDPLPPAPRGDDMVAITEFINAFPKMVKQLNDAWQDIKAEAAQQDKDNES